MPLQSGLGTLGDKRYKWVEGRSQPGHADKQTAGCPARALPPIRAAVRHSHEIASFWLCQQCPPTWGRLCIVLWPRLPSKWLGLFRLTPRMHLGESCFPLLKPLPRVPGELGSVGRKKQTMETQ